MIKESIVADRSLATQGELKIDWAKAHMPVLNRIEEEFKKSQPFKGLKVAICLHLEAKTAYLAKVIATGGGEVTISGSNPLSTQDDVAAALVKAGIRVFAKYNPTGEEYRNYLIKTLETLPDLLIDDGGDLVALLHGDYAHLRNQVRGGCEETTTGIMRLKALEKAGLLTFPMMAVNDALTKHLFDNRYGTGQSVFDGINRTTNLVVAGKTIVVIGYGWCGKGVAMRAKGLGAKVIVTEVDPVKAIEAYMDGFIVMPIAQAAPLGDYFITVTGNSGVLHGEHYKLMKDGAILSNAGHFDVEINIPDLERLAHSKRTVRQNIEEYTLEDGRRLYLLAAGRLVNLAAGDGHPAEIMDMTFALQALSLVHINTLHEQNNEQHKREGKVTPVPKALDDQVARYMLSALQIDIDALSERQQKYLNQWE